MFSNAKVGDRVWCMPLGWGTITEIKSDVQDYPVIVGWDLDGKFGSYRLDGKIYESDLMPFLFWDEIKIIPPPKPKRKVKKTVKGWANIYHLNPGGVTLLYMHNTKESAEKCNVKCEGVCAAPATLTYEIEE